MLQYYFIRIILLIFLIYFIKKYLLNNIKEHFSNKEFKLKILVPFYNPGPKILRRCLESIIRQKNEYNFKYDVCMIDDRSFKEVDELYKIMDEYTSKYPNFYSIKKKENLGTLHSNIMGMKKLNCKEDDVIIILDGDDELYGNDALNIIEKTYRENDVYVTFGNYYRRYNDKISKKINVDCSRDYATIVRNHSYRSMDIWFGFSHLKTFKYKLFASVPDKYFKDKNNNYFKSSTDVATMISVLERSGGKFKCINEPIYIYTHDHPNSHHNNNNGLKKQRKNEIYIRSKAFTPLDPIV
jgi:hypothetical protein